QVSSWWTKGIRGAADRLGDRFTMRSGDSQTFVDLEVVERQPNTRMVWKVTHCNLHWIADTTEWTGTRIVWEITPRGDATEIRMTHVGLHPDSECYSVCKPGWDFHIGTSLRGFLADNTELTAEREAANRLARRDVVAPAPPKA
ncbi:MAG TPA: SRPBCC domain-containing protein, partial [bacterium]|nr:SRPBCC domain-containing protein [bacterium]